MDRPQAESYRTVRGEGRYEETIQKSRFIGIAFRRPKRRWIGCALNSLTPAACATAMFAVRQASCSAFTMTMSRWAVCLFWMRSASVALSAADAR